MTGQPDHTKYIIEQLSRNKSVNDITTTLSQSFGMPWSEAQSLVQRVRQQYKKEIGRGKSGTTLMVGVMSVLIGAGTVVVMVVLWLNKVSIQFGPGKSPTPYIGNIIFGVVGILAALGGLVGVIQAARRAL